MIFSTHARIKKNKPLTFQFQARVTFFCCFIWLIVVFDITKPRDAEKVTMGKNVVLVASKKHFFVFYFV